MEGSASESLDLELASGSGQIPLSVNETEDDQLASLLLSSTATYLHRDSFLDLWTNISSDEPHNLVFVVVNGTISSCLDGEFKLGDDGINLWNVNNSFDEVESQSDFPDAAEETVQVKFSDALHAVHSVVSWVVNHLSGVSEFC